jgi:UDP-N-acetylmuramoylalanine--D-glutamate ligase
MEAYIAAKAQILAHQASDGWRVLNWDDPETRRIGLRAGSQRVVWFSLDREVESGAFLRGEQLIMCLGGREETVCTTNDLKLLGRHNVANTLAACALAGLIGAPVEAVRRVALAFSGVEHRLELVRERGGVRWYNDSIATTPERTVAALKAFHSPIILLAGGRDKHLPWEQMAALTWEKARHLILFGEAAQLIERAMKASRSAGGACQIHQAGDLASAVAVAARVSRPGDVVLLAPGGTSFDAYEDFSARGNDFRGLVRALE